jgi:dTDP-4-amino-4,6-dideoxygalactose transaminase
VAERHALEMISLPLFPGITVDQQQRVVDVMRNALN